MNTVKVKAKFFNEVDGNLDLHNLMVDVSYSIPEVIGFTKYKKISKTLIQDATLQEWVKKVNYQMTKEKVKVSIQSMVMEDIMSRLQREYEKTEPEIVSQVLNMLNQLKFNFTVDLVEAREIVAKTNQVAFPKEKLDADSLFN